jgi:superfamily II DNA or RNA helicase
MNYIISHEGYCIKKSILTPDDLKAIKKELTVTPSTLDFSSKKVKDNADNLSYELFKVTETHIIVPLYYGMKRFGDAKNTIKPIKSKFKFTGKLRDYQIPIVDKCLAFMKKNKGGLLSIPCGGGKTSMALYIASVLGLKTLVVVHKSFLQNQWIERIKQFTTAEPGVIRRKTVDIEGKDIVIGMIQSISKRNYDSEIFKQFSFIIYDESHHSASRVFSRALMKTTGIYTLALSATPYRGDQMIKVMHWFLGDTMYRIKFKINKHVIVKCFYYYSQNEMFKEKKRFIQGQVRPDVTKMMSNLCELKSRTRIIANIIDSIRKDPDRKILILSERKNHLKEMKKLVDRKIEKSVELEEIEEDEIKTYFYIGDMDDAERNEAEKNADILFATYHMAKEGLDIERLNTVILATSQKDVIQSVGRVMRKLLQNGDTAPLIIDFSDDLSAFKNHTLKRKAHYDKCKYTIEDYYMFEKTCMSYDDYKNSIKNISKDVVELKLDDVLKTQKIVLDETIKPEDVIFKNDDSDSDESDDSDAPVKTFKQIWSKRMIPI